jgi:hypothetical protein
MITKPEFSKLRSLGVARIIILAVVLLSLHPVTQHAQDFRCSHMHASVWAWACSAVLCCDMATSPACKDLDGLELFAGKQAVSNALRAAGLATGSFDLEYGRAMDICSPAGMAYPAQKGHAHTSMRV